MKKLKFKEIQKKINEITKRPPSKEQLKELKQRELFVDWFNTLVVSEINNTCLLRDVLRDAKEALWESWKIRKPYE